jgi:hypothetical protein
LWWNHEGRACQIRRSRTTARLCLPLRFKTRQV